MQAVIMAAGKGTRMKELSLTTPKPMLIVAGRNLIQHKIDALPSEVHEVIIVIGHMGDQIQNFFGNEYGGRKITYVWQKELKGTCDAVWQAKDLITGKFLVMMGDDIYHRDELAICAAKEWAILVQKKSGKNRGGRVLLNDQGIIEDIIEGEHEGKDVLLNIGLFVLQKDIFNYEPVKLPGREEWGLPQTLVKAIKDGHTAELVTSTFWIPMTSPEDLSFAEKLLNNSERGI